MIEDYIQVPLKLVFATLYFRIIRISPMPEMIFGKLRQKFLNIITKFTILEPKSSCIFSKP
jgi:hypothetical protein